MAARWSVSASSVGICRVRGRGAKRYRSLVSLATEPLIRNDWLPSGTSESGSRQERDSSGMSSSVFSSVHPSGSRISAHATGIPET